MGTVVVGYVPKPEGEAALNSAIAEAKLRNAKVVVVNSHRGGSEFDERGLGQGRGRDGAHPEPASRRPASTTRSASWCAASSLPRT